MKSYATIASFVGVRRLAGASTGFPPNFKVVG